jgi:uncharacterized PurR-regulated membrane protein YhhQ (DUF165 family)
LNQYFTKKWLFGYSYVISIFLANLAVSYFGIIKLFGLTFPAGALFIGLCFTFRDLVQNEFGHKVWWFMLASMVVSVLSGVVLSHLPIPIWKVALASGVAFLVSESIDWLVYTITKLNLEYRVVVSNIFSGLADSALFVGIAFGAWGWLPPVYGQFIVKYLSGLLVIPLIIYLRSRQTKLVES